MKKLFLLLILLIPYHMEIFAIKPEKELKKIYIGISEKEVKELYGDPKYSKYDKDAKIRMYLYDFYRTEGGLTEYYLYFKNDSLTYVVDKQEKLYSLKDAVYEDSLVHNYTIDGKSLVVSKIIEGITMDEEQVKDAIIVAISRACNGSQGEFKMKKPTRILYHGIIDKVITFRLSGSINVFYSIDIAIKQGRIRIKVIGDEIDWHQKHEKATYYFSEVDTYGAICMKRVSNPEAQELLRNTILTFHQFISVIEEEISKIPEDNW